MLFGGDDAVAAGARGVGTAGTAAMADIVTDSAKVRPTEMREKFMVTLSNGKSVTGQHKQVDVQCVSDAVIFAGMHGTCAFDLAWRQVSQ